MDDRMKRKERKRQQNGNRNSPTNRTPYITPKAAKPPSSRHFSECCWNWNWNIFPRPSKYDGKKTSLPNILLCIVLEEQENEYIESINKISNVPPLSNQSIDIQQTIPVKNSEPEPGDTNV
jgi:hypothetical protein